MNEKRFEKLLKDSRDKRSLEALYRYCYPKIYHHVKFGFGDGEIAKQAARKFFEKVTNMQIDLREKSPTDWVFDVCDGIAADILRFKDVYAEGSDGAQAGDVGNYKFADLFFGENASDLDDLTKRIVIMRLCEGYSVKEIAKKENLSPSEVRRRFSRGTEKLCK